MLYSSFLSFFILLLWAFNQVYYRIKPNTTLSEIVIHLIHKATCYEHLRLMKKRIADRQRAIEDSIIKTMLS